MIRTQIQLPDELDRDLRALAAKKEWTLAETLRRGAEMLLAAHHAAGSPGRRLPLPAVNLGAPRVPENEWRELANQADETR
jgi:hypothetical protein